MKNQKISPQAALTFLHNELVDLDSVVHVLQGLTWTMHLLDELDQEISEGKIKSIDIPELMEEVRNTLPLVPTLAARYIADRHTEISKLIKIIEEGLEEKRAAEAQDSQPSASIQEKVAGTA